MDSVNLLPPELIEKIFNFLSIADLASVSRVSVSWYIASNSSRLWRAAIKHSSSSDRFIKLSDFDKFNGISSNYDSDHSFNVEKPSSSRLPPMNPWKLSLCQHKFLQSNLRGERPNLELARHEIALENGMEFFEIRVTFPSKLVQDCVYLPVLGRKPGEINQDFYLIRLDGVKKVIHLFTTKDEISYACIDRHGIAWVEHMEVKYLSFVENFNSSQIENLGSYFILTHLSSSLDEYRQEYLKKGKILSIQAVNIMYLTMDTNHVAIATYFNQVTIWCRKTYLLEIIIPLFLNPPRCDSHEDQISIFDLKNGHLYLGVSHCHEHPTVFDVEIYDVEEDKFIIKVDVESLTERFVFGIEYYAIISTTVICVCDIKTNKVMFNLNTQKSFVTHMSGISFVDDYFLYEDDMVLKVLNLVDWTVSDGMSLVDYNEIRFDLSVMDCCLLVIVERRIDVWDWKLGRKLQEIAMPPYFSIYSTGYYVSETRLVHVGKTGINFVGFW